MTDPIIIAIGSKIGGVLSKVAGNVFDRAVNFSLDQAEDHPKIEAVREHFAKDSSEKLAFLEALTDAYVEFAKQDKYTDLVNSFFDETFLNHEKVVAELEKALRPHRDPDPQAIIKLWRELNNFSDKQNLDDPVKDFLEYLDNAIQDQPKLLPFVQARDGRQLVELTSENLDIQRDQLDVQNKILEEMRSVRKAVEGKVQANPLPFIPVGDFRATIIDTVIDFTLANKVKQFRGRQALREEVGTWVDNQDYGVLQGFGGIGKTALAAAVVVDHLGADPNNKVVWLKAGNDDGQALLIAIGSADGFNAQQAVASVEGEQRIQLVRQLLHQHGVTLVVLDDVWNGQALSVVQNAMPPKTALLVTSRHRYALQKLRTVYRLEDEEALTVLNTYSGQELSMEDAAELLKIVGNHPYALELAGKTLQVEPQLTADALLKRIKGKPHEMHSDTEADESRASIAALIETSLEALDDEAHNAFLAIGAFFVPRITPELLMMFLMGTPVVPDEMMEHVRAENPPLQDASDDELRPLIQQSVLSNLNTEPAQNALHTLQYRGLAEIDPATESQVASYAIHDLAFSYAQSRNTDDFRQRALTACLNYTQKYNQPSLENFAALRPELENFLGAASWAMTQGDYQAVEQFAWQLQGGSEVLDLQGFYLQAIDLITLAAQAARQRGDMRALGQYLGELGNSFSRLARLSEAIDYYQQALVISREIGDRRGEGLDLGNLGIAYRNLGQVEKAIDHHRQALTISREIGDRRNEGNQLGNLGNAYQSLGQYENAIDYLQQVLAISREMGDHRNEGNSLGNLGNAYYNLGQYQMAINHHQEALVISREIGDRHGEGSILGNLGNAYFSLGQYEKAIDHFQQALVISREIGDRRAEGQDLGNLGLAYRNLGQVDKAIDHYQQSLAMKREIGDRRGEGNSLGNLGSAYASLGQYEKAIDHYQQALTIQREIGDRRGEGETSVNLGTAYKYFGRINKTFAYKALAHYQQARDIFVEIGVPHLIKWANELITDLNSSNPPSPDSS